MGEYPKLRVNLPKLRENARVISELAGRHGMEVTGVTKCSCGDPKVAKAMLEGGVTTVGDSRISNLKRLKDAGIKSDLMLLRTPMVSQAAEVVNYSDISLNSELPVIRELGKAAQKLGKSHRIILMLEMGDLREGVLPSELETMVPVIKELEGIELYGLGMNLACFGGVVPTEKKLFEFSGIVERTEKEYSLNFRMVSGGNSANIPLMTGKHPKSRVNNVRIGEGILLGLETVKREAIPGTHQDVFRTEAEIIELRKKPSVPSGKISQNAFGEKPEFRDMGEINRGIVALGRQDANVEGLIPTDEDVSIIGSSSDHVILKIEGDNYQVGDTVEFGMDYGGLLHLFTSPYVKKVMRD